MINRQSLIFLFLLVFCAVLWPATSQAQTPEWRVIIVYPAAEPQTESMALSVFFTVIDDTGRPIPDPNIESVEIELLGSNNLPTQATVGDPQTPFYVALLLDASGTMQKVMPQVQEAAKKSVDSKPRNARFAVIKFNELSVDDDLNLIRDFTDDPQLVKDAIDVVESEESAPTCLYNALYRTIELLDDQVKKPQERRAIILFTDGKDERVDGTLCSKYTYDDVIYLATRPAAPITPIHTIGLCSNAECSNLKKDELRSMAKDTRAFWAVGRSDQLDDRFQEIMAGLNSQWVAKANVFARKGENQAVLRVKSRDVDIPLMTETFNFDSPKDYAPPLAPVEIYITYAAYMKEQNVFQLALSMTPVEAVGQIIVKAEDTKLGQRGEDHIFNSPTDTMKIEIKPEGFEDGNQIVFQVMAKDKNGNLIGNNKEDKNFVLAETKELTYEPLHLAPVEFKIKSVQPEFGSKKLTIDLELLRGADQVSTYQGYFLDEVSRHQVGDEFKGVYQSNVIEINLPEEVLQAPEERVYLLNLSLFTGDKQPIETGPYKFTPPKRPSFLEQVWFALQNPVVWISAVIIILSVAAVVTYWNRSAEKEQLLSPLPRPPIERTTPGAPDAGAEAPLSLHPAKLRQPCLKLKVLEAPTAPPEKDKLITTFPFVIGRSDSDFNIPDKRISRHHIEFTLQEGKFFVTDLESLNGTFINEIRLPPSTPTLVSGLTILRLGQKIRLEIEPQ